MKTRKLEENLSADALALPVGDLRKIAQALEKVKIEGDRYPPALQARVGR